MPSAKTAKKPAAKKAAAGTTKIAGKKTIARKAKPLSKKAAPTRSGAPDSMKESVSAKELMEIKAQEKGVKIEDIIEERDVQLKSVEDYLGVKQKQDMRNKPVIPGVFDLLIPPGTPRKLIIRLAKEYNLQIVRRDDVYVPIGVCDIERDLLAIRGDEKTVKKLEKILFNEIDSFIEGKDARLHDYLKTPRLDGISGSKTAKANAVKKVKASSK